MKIPKEYSLLFIIGLFVLGYVLDLAVDPMVVPLKSPYGFFTPERASQFPFSALSVTVKALAIFLTPVWLLSFSSNKGFVKPAIYFILSVLLQLYAVQDILTKSGKVSLEWTLSFAAAGVLLLLPTLYTFIRAVILLFHNNLTNAKMNEAIKQAQKDSTKNPPSSAETTKVRVLTEDLDD